jgi:LmbE family N-acetylglucosaminyl deacetylase
MSPLTTAREADEEASDIARWRRLFFLRRAPCHFGSRFLASHIAVVVAHPDDETVGCGALLTRLAGVHLVMVTDGAPRNLADAQRYGFATARAYAAKRFSELRQAIRLAGIAPACCALLRLPDQETALRLPQLVNRLAEIFVKRRIRVVVTHAYEGGHPDHDATAFAVHIAARLLRSRRKQHIEIAEMPLYWLGESGAVHQSFAPGHGEASEIPLSPGEIELKRRMIAAHATQAEVLASFTADHECFRRAPDYDFTRLPNDGRLLYEHQDWGMSGERWLACTAAAMEQFPRLTSSKPGR